MRLRNKHAVILLLIIFFLFSGCATNQPAPTADKGTTTAQQTNAPGLATHAPMPEATLDRADYFRNTNYSPYREAPSQAALDYFRDNLETFTELEQLQAERTPAFIEFLVRKHAGSSSDRHAHINDNPFTEERYPGYLQWDPRWAFDIYSNGYFGQTGCGPTVLAIVYSGLSGDPAQTPDQVLEVYNRHGLAPRTGGTTWELLKNGAEALGMAVKNVPLHKPVMIRSIEQNRPLIVNVGPGDFTSSGHYLVLHGIKDGKFKIYDPFSLTNSKKLWSYETLAGQIRAVWSFSLRQPES